MATVVRARIDFWHGYCPPLGMTKKTILIAGEHGPLRQYIVERLLNDRENVVATVDLLTQEKAKSSRQLSPPDPRCAHYRVAAANLEEIAEIVRTCAPEAIINLTVDLHLKLTRQLH